MTNVLRILLCGLCIVNYNMASADTNESEVVNATSVGGSPEIIPQHFVQIEMGQKNIDSISILQVVKDLAVAAQSQYYSLLAWKYSTRHQDLEIQSFDRVAQFGHWVNDFRDTTCYNTRAKVLIRDSVKPVIFKTSNPCNVDFGKWQDPYARKVLTNAVAEVQIDHMVPLKNAYVSGAHKWEYKKRCLYANYLGAKFHLISVDGTENIRKGSRGPDKYMPPNKEYRCTYLKNWLTIKALWGLEMTVAESEGITKVIKDEGCLPSALRITQAELNRQRKFAHENEVICEKYVSNDLP